MQQILLAKKNWFVARNEINRKIFSVITFHISGQARFLIDWKFLSI